MGGSSSVLGTALVLCVACGAPEPDFHGEEQEPTGTSIQAISVAEAVEGGCSTTSVWGLSTQIIEQMNCLIPGDAMAEVPERPNFQKGSATLAWMQPPAVAAFVAALDEMPETTLTSNSMLRTVAQQYLLYRWYQLGTCNISLAATPGTSNHESGLAIDVSEHGTWQATLEAQGFSWLGSSDPVHFDYAGAGTVDLGGQDVLAFQQLWNLNHPEDPITEDGDYGDETGSRLELSPAEGFVIPPSCGNAGSGGKRSQRSDQQRRSCRKSGARWCRRNEWQRRRYDLTHDFTDGFVGMWLRRGRANPEPRRPRPVGHLRGARTSASA